MAQECYKQKVRYMSDVPDLRDLKVVRLNAELFPISDYEIELFEKYQLNVTPIEAETPSDIIRHVAGCDGLFVVSASLPTEVIDSLSRCRVISRLGTGTDKIDVARATERGILVTNIPDFCIEDQADHAMALMLAIARKLPAMGRAILEGAWSRSRDESNTGHRVSTGTLGLVGFGGSAKEMAKRAAGFGMRILATRKNMDGDRTEADRIGVQMVDLETVLTQSDYISLHLPLNQATRHMFDEKMLKKCKPGAVLINTARGALVDELALASVLREGHLSAAGLDTFEQIDVHTKNESPPSHPLLKLANVIFTPHVAALSIESKRDNNRGGVENLAAVLSGRWPEPGRIVNPTVVPRNPLE